LATQHELAARDGVEILAGRARPGRELDVGGAALREVRERLAVGAHARHAAAEADVGEAVGVERSTSEAERVRDDRDVSSPPIAAAANIGPGRTPNAGNRTPAASGMPTAL